MAMNCTFTLSLETGVFLLGIYKTRERKAWRIDIDAGLEIENPVQISNSP